MDELKRLREENARLREENLDLKRKLATAKDPDPVKRPSLKRVTSLVNNACMRLERRADGRYILRLGHLFRHFRHLRDIWLLLTEEDWKLSDIFPVENPWTPPLKPTPKRPHRYPSLAPANNLYTPYWHRERIDFLAREEVMRI